jgi:formylmethanofuran dehydrogenase subunit E
MTGIAVTRVDRELLACLERASEGHRRLCPRQVLGVRIGQYAGALLGLSLPQQDKRLYAFVETDGCTVDGIVAATGCTVGRRTMHILDFGKVAATFVDTLTGEALRIRPHPQARQRARAWAPTHVDDWHAMLEGYCNLPADEVLHAAPATLTVSIVELIGRPGLRVPCDQCGEEIMNGREVRTGERTLCRSCAGESYVAATDASLPIEVQVGAGDQHGRSVPRSSAAVLSTMTPGERRARLEVGTPS